MGIWKSHNMIQTVILPIGQLKGGEIRLSLKLQILYGHIILKVVYTQFMRKGEFGNEKES